MERANLRLSEPGTAGVVSVSRWPSRQVNFPRQVSRILLHRSPDCSTGTATGFAGFGDNQMPRPLVKASSIASGVSASATSSTGSPSTTVRVFRGTMMNVSPEVDRNRKPISCLKENDSNVPSSARALFPYWRNGLLSIEPSTDSKAGSGSVNRDGSGSVAASDGLDEDLYGSRALPPPRRGDSVTGSPNKSSATMSRSSKGTPPCSITKYYSQIHVSSRYVLQLFFEDAHLQHAIYEIHCCRFQPTRQRHPGLFECTGNAEAGDCSVLWQHSAVRGCDQALK